MKKSIYDHHVRGGPSAPMAADKPGDLNSGKLRPSDLCHGRSR